jgi:prepilin-type N-terminal cleavage/methylation domain-containing protein
MLVRNHSREPANPRAGFTLTEMLVVVAIIVVLAGIAVPITMNVLSESKIDIAKAHMKGTLVPAVQRFQLKNNEQLPGSLRDLLADPRVGLKEDALLDPWGGEYQIVADNSVQEGFVITCNGPGGQVITSHQR